ncbi:translational GTPase TypA, partial [Staphylococcus aureus]|nr:translational GTPase TypA [Staphylococcus aureus]
IAVSGMEEINVGETVTPHGHQESLAVLRIDEPTLEMTFKVNNSSFAGREGDFVTARQIQERLNQQLETDVSLKVSNSDSPDTWVVAGRGELHLAILNENMSREDYELQVSKPQVIIKEIDGVMCKPFERVQCEVPQE